MSSSPINGNSPNPSAPPCHQRVTSRLCNTNVGSSLSSSGDSSEETSFTEYFTKAWEYIKWPFSILFSWVQWALPCFFGSADLRLIEEMIDSPDSCAKKFAGNFSKHTAQLLTALLSDPKGAKELYDDPDNEGSLRTFFINLAGELHSTNPLPTQKPSQSFGQEFAFSMASDPAVGKKAISIFCQKFVQLINQKVKPNDEAVKKEYRALRILFETTVPKALENNGNLAQILEAIKNPPSASNRTPADRIIHFLHKCLTLRGEYFTPEEKTAYQTCNTVLLGCSGVFYTLTQLIYADKHNPYEIATSSFVEALSPKQFETLAKTHKDNPLAKALAQQLASCAKQPKKWHAISQHISKALPLLDTFYDRLNGEIIAKGRR